MHLKNVGITMLVMIKMNFFFFFSCILVHNSSMTTLIDTPSPKHLIKDQWNKETLSQKFLCTYTNITQVIMRYDKSMTKQHLGGVSTSTKWPSLTKSCINTKAQYQTAKQWDMCFGYSEQIFQNHKNSGWAVNYEQNM